MITVKAWSCGAPHTLPDPIYREFAAGNAVMDYVRQIVKIFHDEHLATLAILARFGALLDAHREGVPTDAAAAGDFARMMRDIEALIASDLVAHFAFEENSLFPVMEAAGYGAMGALLAEEHVSIRVTAGQLVALFRAVRAVEVKEADWRDIRRLGFEFMQQMTVHIEKEEMGLLATLDDVVEEGQDADLAMAYSAAR
ncbi:MAG: hemerythrin domain-containing protein [Alphaproteobacteria bacterium]